MKVKRLIKYYLLRESIREIELNEILDKVSKKIELTERERNFLSLYQTTREDQLKDFLYLSKNSCFKKCSEILECGKKLICNLHDRNGKFGLQVTKLENTFESGECLVFMRGGESHKLHEKFLYNIIYSIKKDEYSLEEQGEYFEKLNVNDEN
jgi:hypothetical protein